MKLVVMALIIGCASACTKAEPNVVLTVFESSGTELVRVRADGVIRDSHGTDIASVSDSGTVTMYAASGSSIVVQVADAVIINGDTYRLRGMTAGDLTVEKDGVIRTDGRVWGRVDGYRGNSRRTRLAAAFVVIEGIQPSEPASTEITPPSTLPPPPPPPLGAP